MIKFQGFGRLALAAVLTAGVAIAGVARADDIAPEHLKAARAALTAVKATAPFDQILPSLAENLKATMIQSSPNYLNEINEAVDAKALELAARRADLEKEAANIYAKTFTIEELNAITAFYTSPAGKKLLSDGPIATRELGKAADIWASGISRDLAKQSDDVLEKVIGAEKKAEEAAPQ